LKLDVILGSFRFQVDIHPCRGPFMALPSCLLAPLFELLCIPDFLRLLATGRIGYAVGNLADGVTCCPYQSFLAGIIHFLAGPRRGGLRTPLCDGVLPVHIRLSASGTFEGLKAQVAVAWNVDLGLAEPCSQSLLLALNETLGHLDAFQAGLQSHFRAAYLLRDACPMDARLPLVLPASALLGLPPGGRGQALGVSYFFLWVDFVRLHSLLTVGYVNDLRLNPGEPGRHASFYDHATFLGPFPVDSDTD